MNDTPETQNQKEEQESVFFLLAALAVYRADDKAGTPRQRYVNVLLEHNSMHLSKRELDEAQRGVMRRVHAENGVAPDRIMDIVIISTNILGMMKPSIFYASDPDQSGDQTTATQH